MMNDILKNIEKDKDYIENYPLETTEGTQKLMHDYYVNAINTINSYINQKIAEYTKLKEDIYANLKRRVDEIIPCDTTAAYNSLIEKIGVYKRIINFNNDYNNYYEKLDYDKIVDNIDDIDISNLTRVNSLIGRIITLFNQANINLTADDFDYTMYSKKYMQVYFNSMNKEDFKDEILKVFNQIYWECPELTMHIGLSLRRLYYKYEKELGRYCISVRDELFLSNNTDINNYFTTYTNLTASLEDMQRKDAYLASKRFLDGELLINDFLPGSAKLKQHLNRFLIDKDFDELTEEQKDSFFTRIKILKYLVVELNNYNKYKGLLKDIVTRYNKKDNYKLMFQNKLKEIEKEEKERINLYNKYNKKDIKFLFFNKTVNRDLLKVQMNEQVKKIAALYAELEDILVNEVISTKLNDTSTIDDALKVCASYYSYFKSLYPEIETGQDDFNYIKEFLDLNDFVYDIDNAFIKKVKFLDDSDINEVIVNKYKLLNINLTKEDLVDNIEDLEKSIDFINLYHSIDISDISVESIKVILDFEKISKTQ